GQIDTALAARIVRVQWLLATRARGSQRAVPCVDHRVVLVDVVKEYHSRLCALPCAQRDQVDELLRVYLPHWRLVPWATQRILVIAFLIHQCLPEIFPDADRSEEHTSELQSREN